MTNKQLLEKLNDINFFPSECEDFDFKAFEEVGLEKPIQIEQVGGEGEGDHYHVVYHFPSIDKYIRADAFYASYYGVDNWDSVWSIVRPKQVTITVYE